MYPRKKKRFLLFILVIVLCIAFIKITADNRNSVNVLDNIISFVTKPFNKVASTAVNKAAETVKTNKKALMEQNAELEKKIAELEKKNSALNAASVENDRLRGLLDLKDKSPQYELTACNAFSRSIANYSDSFFIDKGSKDGIIPNLPVIGSKGLIGYVVETGRSWSRVRTILDGGSNVGCVVTRTQSTAVAEGNNALLPNGLLSMIFVSKDMNIIEGDIIETSGLGQIYPPGITIGKISEITSDEISKSQFATIQPAENFENIKEVFVITKYIEPGAAAETDITEAAEIPEETVVQE